MKVLQPRQRVATLRFTQDQYEMIKQRAARCGVRVGPWVRSILLQVAKKSGSPGYVRVKEPDGTST